MSPVFTTRSRGKAFFHSFLSGLAEPIGALLAYVALLPVIEEHPVIVECLLAGVGGVMVFISFDELLPTARGIAAEIVENTSAVSVCLSRQLLWKMLGADHPMEAHKLDSKAIRWMGRSPDAYEGVSSFLEKRPAHFRMSASRDLPEFFPWWEERRFSGDR